MPSTAQVMQTRFAVLREKRIQGLTIAAGAAQGLGSESTYATQPVAVLLRQTTGHSWRSRLLGREHGEA